MISEFIEFFMQQKVAKAQGEIAEKQLEYQRSVASSRCRNFIQRHRINVDLAKARLSSGHPLTAQEMVEGVRLSHEEYVKLVELATIGYRSVGEDE